MKKVTTLTTTAEYSKDTLHRYSLKKVWDTGKPSLLVIMLVAGGSDGVYVDSSTSHVLENAVRLGYGAVTICNLFSCIGDYKLQQDDSGTANKNMQAILSAAKEADAVVYCAGRGKAALKVFQQRERDVLSALLEETPAKLYCISDGLGHTLFHPLSPRVKVWELVPLSAANIPSLVLCSEPTPVQETGLTEPPSL